LVQELNINPSTEEQVFLQSLGQ